MNHFLFLQLLNYYFSYLSGLTFKDVEPTYTKDGLVNIAKLQ